ncbi:MAG: hypothetical protein QNJ53_06155 [Pleurocapsa sp. MO_192.B19]|nr:hypothetical protein [Pleurocapsa sp. MO_192.B19]
MNPSSSVASRLYPVQRQEIGFYRTYCVKPIKIFGDKEGDRKIKAIPGLNFADKPG